MMKVPLQNSLPPHCTDRAIYYPKRRIPAGGLKESPQKAFRAVHPAGHNTFYAAAVLIQKVLRIKLRNCFYLLNSFSTVSFIFFTE
jgi:hypothetical protein